MLSILVQPIIVRVSDRYIRLNEARILSNKKSREEFNRELVETLQKIVSPRRLDNIYDKVISHQKTDHSFQRQQAVLSVIQDYINEIDGLFKE